MIAWYSSLISSSQGGSGWEHKDGGLSERPLDDSKGSRGLFDALLYRLLCLLGMLGWLEGVGMEVRGIQDGRGSLGFS